jgi:hypothetical protein
VPSVKHEVARAAYTMLQALTVFRDREPLTEHAGRAADEFNTLLARARYGFPASRPIQSLQIVEPHAPLATLLTRLALLKGAIDIELIRAGEGAVGGTTYAFWAHPSRGVYAVQLIHGELRGCCMVTRSDLDSEVLPFLPYHRGYELQWIREHRREFTTLP